jgi:hypothetical protein
MYFEMHPIFPFASHRMLRTAKGMVCRDDFYFYFCKILMLGEQPNLMLGWFQLSRDTPDRVREPVFHRSAFLQ